MGPWVARGDFVIRQAHSYLAGALSGTALIALAIVAFVVLVSLQAVRDWPLADVGGGDQAGISAGRPASGAPSSRGNGGVTARRSGAGGRQGTRGGDSRAGKTTLGPSPTSAAASPVDGAPGAADTGAAGGNGSPSGAASAGSGGGGEGKGGGSSTSGSTSGTVAGTVNNAVSGVDSATGGALGEAGATQVTEEAVNGVAGPESPLGKTVDKAAEAVGSLTGS
jgi:hypothetical protein